MVSLYTNFDWETAPMRGIAWPIGAAAVYLAVVAAMMPAQEGTPRPWVAACLKKVLGVEGKQLRATLTKAMAYHNLILCAWSAIMFVGAAWEVAVRGMSDGGEWMFCEAPSTTATGPLYFWSYVYYISKFYELLDTVLKFAKGSKGNSLVLHIVHHAAVVYMSWLWLETRQSLQFIGLMFNTFVHIIMYYYYYLRSSNIAARWGSNITQLQIVQFATSFVSLAYTLYLMFGRQLNCAGPWALVYNGVFNCFLLLEFAKVFMERRAAAAAAKKAKAEAKDK